MKLFLSILLFSPVMVFAQSEEFLVDDSRVVEENPGDSRGGLSSGSQSEYQEPEDTGSELGETGAFGVTQQGGLDGTTDAQGQGSQVQLMGLAMGAMFASQCGPHNAFACVAAGLSFADAMAGGSAQNAAYQTGTYIDPTAGYDGDNGGTDPLIDQQIQDGIQDLSDAGFIVNGDGSVTGPDGQTFTADDLQSPEAMMAKGATAEQAANFMDQAGKVRTAAAKKAGIDLPEGAAGEEGQAVAAAGADGGSFGSGGSGSGSAVGALDGGVIEEIEYRGGKKQKRGIAEAAASKLSKNFNGDPIGIGLGNLFLIVHQKYGSEKKKKRFFNREIVSKGQ